jgi:hypothetical protein
VIPFRAGQIGGDGRSVWDGTSRYGRCCGFRSNPCDDACFVGRARASRRCEIRQA